MVELKALKLRPTQALASTSPTPAVASYMGVSVLTQLTSLALALPVLGTQMMEVVGRMTGLEVSIVQPSFALPAAILIGTAKEVPSCCAGVTRCACAECRLDCRPYLVWPRIACVHMSVPHSD